MNSKDAKIVKSICMSKRGDSYCLLFLYDEDSLDDGELIEEGDLSYISNIYRKMDGDHWKKVNYLTAYCMFLKTIL